MFIPIIFFLLFIYKYIFFQAALCTCLYYNTNDIISQTNTKALLRALLKINI